MAEGFARKLSSDWKVYSAGVRADGLNPYAVQVMKEIGIDITSQRSKTIDSLKDIKPDVVITLCDNAKESCPIFLSAKKIEHWGLPDPVDATGSDEDKLKVYRSVRDEIVNRLRVLYKQGGQ
jgi:arsenate reductase